MQEHLTPEEWEQLFDTAPDALAVCDAGGRVLHGNRAFLHLCGQDRAAVLLCPLDEIPGLGPLALSARVREALDRGEAPIFDQGAGGRTYTVTIAPISGEGGNKAVLLLRDVTDERRLQRRLLLGERMAAVGQLAAGLAHEINNPVSFAYSNLQVAQQLVREEHEQGRGLPPALAELPEMLSECMVGISRVRDIVRDLRTFTSTEVRVAAGEVRLDDIVELGLRLTRSEVQRRARLVYDRELLPLPPIRGDAGKLSHVLMNLLAHALHNLPPEETQAHSIIVRTRVDHRRGLVELIVADSGTTLADETRAHLFEPFAQRRRLAPELSAQIGMGLAVSYEIVRRHGGDIEARPGPRGGNELHVRLPLHEPPPPP